LDGNRFELEVFERYPELQSKVKDLKHDDAFKVDDDFEIKSLFTPGHA